MEPQKNRGLESSIHLNLDSASQRNLTGSASMGRTSSILQGRRHDSLGRTNSSRSWRRNSRGSISLSRSMGDQILSSIRLSHEYVDQILGDVDSSVMAQIGDSGDRVVDEDEVDDNESLNQFANSAKSLENRVGPLPDDALMLSHGLQFHEANSLSSISPLAEDTLSTRPTEAILGTIKNDAVQLVQSSSTKEKQYKLPRRLDYCAYLIHLSVFGFLGVFTRYLLQKLFGPNLLALTSDHSPLYLDLPSNILGSFFMGWLGIVLKADIRHISDHLVVGLTTGYMGSLTTFSGWNQKMLDLSSKGHWVFAVAGIVLGMFIVNESIAVGVESAEGLRKWYLKWYGKRPRRSTCNLEHWRVDSGGRHAVVLTIMSLILVSLWCLSGALAIKKLHKSSDGAVLWLGCLVAPPGVWARWYLARLNGEGLGKRRLLKWLPFGTLCANVLAACLMATLAVISKAVNTKRSGIILSGIQLGFLGCLSTVSTFVAEVYTMRQSGHCGRAFIYAASTFLLSFAMGTLIFSVPVWVKHYN
ncbi:uncharacterized protein [Typha latifolia]|uniref:uncharacterized protein n=1 Tax=Typha latifolia TaxID=4733 RepID=UPI003C30D53E